MHVLHPIGELAQVEDERGGDVVGQVAEDAQGRFAFSHQGAEVEAHGVGLDHRQLVLEGRVLAQASRQIPVKLDHRHLVHLGGDRFGQCRQTRADFHQVLTRLRVDGGDYLIDHITVVQEVLTETLTGRVAHVHLVALHLTAHIFFSLPSGWRG